LRWPQRYLAIEQVRFGERLQLEWALDPKAGQAKLPPLLLQPLVENAVRHGVEPSDSGAHLRISTQRRGSVVHQGDQHRAGGSGQPGHGLALDNVRDRLRLLHDVQGQFRSGWSKTVCTRCASSSLMNERSGGCHGAEGVDRGR
jgi:two-component system sensor histidine kinase AlgZ